MVGDQPVGRKGQGFIKNIKCDQVFGHGDADSRKNGQSKHEVVSGLGVLF
jgi:hypothetical protein